MARLGNEAFDAHADENQGGLIVDPGDYDLVVVGSEFKENNKKTGNYLNVTIEIVTECKFKGTRFWEIFNWENPNAVAQQIGRSQFAILCKQIGKPQVMDSDELNNIPFKAPVIIKEGSGSYSDSNGIDFNALSKIQKGKEVPTVETNPSDDIPAAYTGQAKTPASVPGKAPWK